ncbi:hypothetical protein [Microbacterium sp. ZOR0019]|nr:hypothetical protein [Microbacterium sp. ZOR0019]
MCDDCVGEAAPVSTLRFTYELIIDDWPLVEAAIRGALARGAHLAPALL